MDQQEIEAFKEQVKLLTEGLQGLTGATKEADQTLSGQLSQKFPNAAKPTIAALTGLGNAITDTTKAIYRGQRGMTVMADGIDKLVDGFQVAAAIFTTLTPMGKALSVTTKILVNGVPLLAKLFSGFNKLSAEQSDALFKTYQDLSKVGAVGAGGLETLMTNLQELGFSVAELDQFSNAIKKNSKDLTLLGATAQSGAMKLGEVSGAILKSDMGQALQMMGYSAEDLADSTMALVNLQTRLGRVQGKTTAELALEGAKFAAELDKMARLTGISREEQEQARKSMMDDERYAAFMAGEARERNYDVQGLESFLATITNPETRRGLQHLAAGGGTATSEEARRVMFTDPQAYQRMMAVMERRSGAVEAAQGFAAAQGRYAQTYAGTVRYTGQGPGVSFGGGGGAVMQSERMKAMEAAAAEAGMSLEEFARNEQKMAEFNQGQLKEQVETRRKQMNIGQTLDSTVNQFVALNKSASALTSAFDKLSRVGPTPAGGRAEIGVGGGLAGLAGLREMIASGESGGNYNVMVGGQNADLTNMTIAQVMELQKKRVAGGQGSAAGKYQIVNKTLEGLIKEGNIDTGAKFDQAMQDRLADMLIKRRGYGDFQTGKISKEQFAKNLSQEWAALPSGPGNQSYYQGVGNNKANTTWDQVLQNLKTVPTAPTAAPAPAVPSGVIGGYAGNNVRISGPMSGYRPNVLGHGDEQFTIRPMGVGTSNPSASATEGTMLQLIDKVDELISVNKSQLRVDEKILKAQV